MLKIIVFHNDIEVISKITLIINIDTPNICILANKVECLAKLKTLKLST